MTMAPDGYPRFSIQWFKSSGPLEHNLRVPQLLKQEFYIARLKKLSLQSAGNAISLTVFRTTVNCSNHLANGS